MAVIEVLEILVQGEELTSLGLRHTELDGGPIARFRGSVGSGWCRARFRCHSICRSRHVQHLGIGPIQGWEASHDERRQPVCANCQLQPGESEPRVSVVRKRVGSHRVGDGEYVRGDVGRGESVWLRCRQHLSLVVEGDNGDDVPQTLDQRTAQGGVRPPPAHLLCSLSLHRIRIDRYEQERALTLDLHLQLIAIVHRCCGHQADTIHRIEMREVTSQLGRCAALAARTDAWSDVESTKGRIRESVGGLHAGSRCHRHGSLAMSRTRIRSSPCLRRSMRRCLTTSVATRTSHGRGSRRPVCASRLGSPCLLCPSGPRPPTSNAFSSPLSGSCVPPARVPIESRRLVGLLFYAVRGPRSPSLKHGKRKRRAGSAKRTGGRQRRALSMRGFRTSPIDSRMRCGCSPNRQTYPPLTMARPMSNNSPWPTFEPG